MSRIAKIGLIGNKEAATQLIYILAASHSGSTLLAILLSAHSEICTVGELKLTTTAMGNVEEYHCSCGEPVLKCGFWRRVTEKLRAKGMCFDFTDAQMDYRQGSSRYADRLCRPLHRGWLSELLRDCALAFSTTWRRRYPEIQRRNVVLADTVLEIAGKRVLVDSSKIALRLKYLLRNPSLDVKVIRLIRDGRAVALTYMAPARYAAAADPALQQRHAGAGMPMAQAARAWRRSIEEAEHVLARLEPSRWVQIRYEDLCTNVDQTLTKLFQFIGVKCTARIPPFRSVERHVLGNDMRFDKTSDVRLDERWRQVLRRQELRDFDRVAGLLNRKYGYE